MLPDRASGTLTFLFTDLEGSTRLWERYPQAMKSALERHDSILQAAVTTAGGQVVKTTGDGLMAVFGSAVDALRASLAAQHGLMEEPWPETGVLLVRMGLHSGEAQPRGHDYFGPAVIRGARIMAVGHGARCCCPAPRPVWLRIAPGRPGGPRRLSAQDLGRPEEPPAGPPGASPRLPAACHTHRRPNNLPTQTSTFIDATPSCGRSATASNGVGATAHHRSGRYRQDPPRAPGGRR